MIKRNKKGFTIVELVIVIAIVAILAAVLIPTFSSIIERANDSSDIQTVRQLNTAVAAEAAEKGRPLTYDELLDVLEDYDFTLENLTPAGKDNEFLWHKGNNIFILVDRADGGLELIYPVEDSNGDITIVDEEGNLLPDIEEIENIIEDLENGEQGGGNEISDEAALIAALQGTGGEFKLTSSLTLDSAVTVENNVTLDLDGNTLTVEALNITDSGELNVFGGAVSVETTVENEGTLKLENTNISVSGGGIYDSSVYNSNTFTLSGDSTLTVSIENGLYNAGIYNTGNLTLENESEINVTVSGNGVQGIYNDGTINISNLTVSSTGDSAKGIDNYGGTLTVTGSEITVNGTSSIAVNSSSWSSEAPSIITLDNTTISVSGSESSGVYNNNSGELTTTIMNSDITVSGEKAYAVYNRNGECTVVISNTDVTVTGSGAFGLHNGQKASTATIEGGTFKAEGTNSIHSLIFVQAGTVNISGTEITGSAAGYEYNAPIAIYELNGRSPRLILADVTINSNQHCLYSNEYGSKTTTNTEEYFTCGAGYNIFKCGYNPCSEVCVSEHYVVGG